MTRIFTTMPVKKKIILTAAISCILVFTMIALASGEGGSGPTTFSGMSPAGGTDIGTAKPNISILAADPDKINESSIQVRLNGKILPVRVTFPQTGHYEDLLDTCTGQVVPTWVFDGFDYTQATITATAASFPDQNTVTVSVSDQLGNNSSTEWNFNAMIKPQIKNLSPVNGKTVGPDTVISAQVTDNGVIDPQSIIMKIGAAQVVPSYDQASGTITYDPAEPLPAGGNNFYLEVKDTAGNQAVASWSVTVSADTSGPRFSGMSPADGTDIGAAKPNISIVAADPDKINESSIQVKLNGKILPVRVTFPQTGHYEDLLDTCSGMVVPTWVPDGYDYTQATITATVASFPDQNTVTVSVSDQLGNNSSTEWNFNAMIKPQIKNLSPVNGSTVGPDTVISAQVSDNGVIDPQSIIMKIGTSQVVPSYDQTSGNIIYDPAQPLPAGENNIYLEIKDTAGNQAVASWSATISADTTGPVFSGLYPADGAAIQSSSTQISLTVSDTDKIDTTSVKVTVNGKVVPSTVTLGTIGHLGQVYDTCTGTYIEAWIEDGPDPTKATVKASVSNLPDANSVSVSASDQLGNISSSGWKFNAMVPPSISEMIPGNGQNTTDTLTKISAKVTDLGIIDPNSVVMKLDGAVVSHQYTAINQSSGVVSYTPVVPLTAGTHSVTLVVRDAAGNSKTAVWSFFLTSVNTVFSGETPAVDATVNASNTAIRVNVTDDVNLSQGTLRVTVNGTPVNASISFKETGHYEQQFDTCTGEQIEVWVRAGYDYRSGTVTAQSNVLPDGKITVSVTIGNVAGISSTHSWTFNVNVPPSVTQPAPAANSTVKNLTPVISARITDNGSISAVKMTVNGTEVPAAYDAVAGSVNYIPSSPLVNDTNYTVAVTATDSGGAQASLSWTFYTQTYADMEPAGPCIDCHIGYPSPGHPMSNCYGCHQNGPIGDCADCHAGEGEHSPSLISVYNCDYCHNATYSYKIPLHPADVSIYHNTTSNMDSCKECHQTSLTIEHDRHTDEAGNRYTCNTCHQSSRPEVQQAVAQKLKNCDACHTSVVSHEEKHAGSALDDNCTTCHVNSLTQEHLTNTTTQASDLNCDTCHKNTDPDVWEAIRTSDKNCAACHQQGHNILFGEPTPSDVPLYEGFRWSIPSDIKLWSGEPWVPAEYLNSGKVIMSNRRSDITAAQVWSYYQVSMADQGWTLLSTAPVEGENMFSVTFSKESRKMTIWFYGGAVPGQSQPLEGGYRIAIAYK